MRWFKVHIVKVKGDSYPPLSSNFPLAVEMRGVRVGEVGGVYQGLTIL